MKKYIKTINQGKVKHLCDDAIHATRDFIHLTAITYSPAMRLHANPSDWIEKRPFENGLFSCEKATKSSVIRGKKAQK